jgi:hypothetical protein
MIGQSLCNAIYWSNMGFSVVEMGILSTLKRLLMESKGIVEAYVGNRTVSHGKLGNVRSPEAQCSGSGKMFSR